MDNFKKISDNELKEIQGGTNKIAYRIGYNVGKVLTFAPIVWKLVSKL